MIWQVVALPEWKILGFNSVQAELKYDIVGKLKIPNNPPTFKLVELLEKTPPKDDETARKWFEVLAGRISGPSSYTILLLYIF
jgi:Protein of unknown function (DUF3684)